MNDEINRENIDIMKQKLFRYMTLSKFTNIIDNSKLYFSRIDRNEDIEEGQLLPNFIIEDRNKLKKHLVKLSKCTYISCWKMDDTFDLNSLQKYCGDHIGISIETTVNKLINTIRSKSKIFKTSLSDVYKMEEEYITYYFGKVYYENNLEIIKDNMNLITMFKRKKYKSENEFRVVKYNTSYNKDYSNKDINLSFDHFEKSFNNIENLINRLYIEKKYIAFLDKIKSKLKNIEIELV